MQSVDLTVRLPDSMRLPIPEHVDRDAVDREELLSWQLHEEEGIVCFLSLVAGDLESCRAVVDDLDVVHRYDFTPVDSDTFYVYAEMDVRRADRALLSAFNDRGLVLVPPVTYTNAATIHVTVLGTQDALGRVVDGYPDEVRVDIERVGEHCHLSGSLAGRLTRRQFEAIDVARDLGYYAVPREATLAEVATALDCSESAASTLIRKAEHALVDSALG
jgi:predicted DNA binding protein